MEKIVAKQLIAYLVANNLMPKLQSGFRSGHSTETAILRVLSDIYSSIDQGQVVLLALLDVSAAFKTVDHDILLERLSKSFGITGSAHHWIRSFLTSWTQTVYVGASTSTAAPVRWGSVLGPLPYILYTADVAGIVTSFGLGVHLYADDTQLHGSCLASDAETLLRLVLRSIKAVRLWMASNRLWLNPNKTQFLWLGTRQQLAKRTCDRLLQALAVGTFARRVEGTSLSQERIQLSLGGAVSPFPGRPFGTPYRRKFEKLWTMLNCSREGWKHSTCWSNSNTSVDSYQKSVPHHSSINQSIKLR